MNGFVISIHAPPRGATAIWREASPPTSFQFTPLREGRQGTDRDYIAQIMISIHAPPRGATLFSISCGLSAKFQFTPLREGRL